MNWYKKAMPLPPAINYPHGFDHILDNHLNTDEANQIGEDHSELEWLGNGDYGIAYSHENPDTVIKITRSPLEAEIAASLIGKDIPCCIKIYNVQQINATVWKIETEKVRSLSYEEKDAVNAWKMNQQYIKGMERVAEQFQELEHCLEYHDILTSDMHCNNIGYKKDGTMVLLDVGVGDENVDDYDN